MVCAHGIDTTSPFQDGYDRAVFRITHDGNRNGSIQAFLRAIVVIWMLYG